MEYGEFIKSVSERADLEREQAEKASRATLSSLAERLAGGEFTDLASQLPQELQDAVMEAESAGEGHSLSADEFVAVVARRESAGIEEARPHVKAVLTTVRDAVTQGEFDDLLSQLPDDFRELVEA